MSNTGFKSNGRSNAEEPDKVDMSLDDIIRLNRKKKPVQRPGPGKQRLTMRGGFSQGRRAGPRPGVPSQRGRGVNNKRGVTRGVTRGVSRGVSRGVTRGVSRGGRTMPPQFARRRGQGVITGLAARKTATLLKGVSPLNRPALTQKPRPFVQRQEGQRRPAPVQRRPFRQMESVRAQSSVKRRPVQLRRWTAPPVHQAQREARQATFLFRRGLKVHAQVQKVTPPLPTQRTRPWRTSTTSSGILTVSIDNPTARTQPEPPHSWSLHPSTPVATPVKMEPELERKPPKGVALQFDINSVGKQTTLTLNERFRILKAERAVAAQSKGGRFVTVG